MPEVKERIKIDTLLLVMIVSFTGFVFYFMAKYPSHNYLWDDILSFVGFMTIFKGVFLRMAARGHKKFHSQKSEKLVINGIYRYVRNPMYLGSYLIGAGFLLLLWPWWTLPIFTCLFYLRFKRQVEKEEKILSKTFGKEYTTYCEKVPRYFPSLKTWFQIKPQEVLSIKQAFSTKEKFGLITWPLLALFLKILEATYLSYRDISHTFIIFITATVCFIISFSIFYVIRK